MTPSPSGEEVSGVELQPAGLCGALPESVPAAEERNGGAVWTADGLRPRPPTRLLCRPVAALHPQSDARTSAVYMCVCMCVCVCVCVCVYIYIYIWHLKGKGIYLQCLFHWVGLLVWYSWFG